MKSYCFVSSIFVCVCEKPLNENINTLLLVPCLKLQLSFQPGAGGSLLD
jgi:hypothetical protein